MHTYSESDDRFSRPLVGSVVLHAALLTAAALSGYLHFLANKDTLGDINGGSLQYGEVTATSTIPLPRRETRPNPVANDTNTDIPQPKARPREVAREDPDAIPLKNRHDKKKERLKERELRAINTHREEPIRPNQTTVDAGRALSNPMIGVQGAGGVGIATNNPFGNRFGAYAGILQRLVMAKWQAQGVNVRTARPVIITVEIQRDGSFRVVSVAQPSGDYAVDTGARRALSDVGQFPPLPPGFDRNSAVVDFSFRVL